MIINKIKAKEKTPQLNIEELHRIREKKIKEKLGAFKEVLRMCHLQIKKTSINTNDCYCFYVIPQMVIGYPLYDINACTLYVVEKLVENGFNVVYTHPSLLLISWYVKPLPTPPIEDTLQQKESKPIFRPISQYNPSQNFIGGNSNSNSNSNQNYQEELKKKANQLLSDF